MKKYKTILADPPWEYRNKKMIFKDAWKPGDAGASSKYKTMSIDEIKSLKIIQEIRDKDCVLFLWTTFPILPEVFIVMKQWGFQYKTSLVWIKSGLPGMGFWFRVQGEICLVGIRGKIKAFRSIHPNIFFAPVSKHSRKPERFFQMIDPIIPRPAIELFARKKREGWDSWGDEIEEELG